MAYNDLSHPERGLIEPVSEKGTREFKSGNMRHHPAAAIYYLMGGEAVQDALYNERLNSIKHQYGITIHSSHDPSFIWPDKVTLSPFLTGSFAQLPDTTSLQATFQSVPHLRHRIELQQGYQPPRPQPKFAGKVWQTGAVAWESTPVDPTEALATTVPPYKPRTVGSEGLPAVPATIDLVKESQMGSQGIKWTMSNLHRLDLWGTEEDPFETTPETLAQEQEDFRRQKGFRPASPTLSKPAPYKQMRTNFSEGECWPRQSSTV